jgi:hypothetical protein
MGVNYLVAKGGYDFWTLTRRALVAGSDHTAVSGGATLVDCYVSDVSHSTWNCQR